LRISTAAASLMTEILKGKTVRGGRGAVQIYHAKGDGRRGPEAPEALEDDSTAEPCGVKTFRHGSSGATLPGTPSRRR